jgi:hypothetical protein
MTLTTIVALTGVLSNLAVLGSLIFLMRQMRQNARHQQATMRHGRVQQLQLIYQQASEADFTDTFIRGQAGDTSLDARDCNRFVWFAATMFNMFQNMFDQHRDGIIDKTTFATAQTSMRYQLAMPGTRAAWTVLRDHYEIGFVAYLDALMADTPMDGVPDVSAAWRSAVPQSAPA